MAVWKINDNVKDECWERLDPFRDNDLVVETSQDFYEISQDATLEQRKLLGCLFHALLHFGEDGPLAANLPRWEYFSQVLEPANPNILRSMADHEGYITFDFGPDRARHPRRIQLRKGLAYGYLSVIPLTEAGVRDYLLKNQITHDAPDGGQGITQFQLAGHHIANYSKHIYVQAVAVPHGIFQGVDRVGGDVHRCPNILWLDRLRKHMRGLSPQDPNDELSIYFEVYEDRLLLAADGLLRHHDRHAFGMLERRWGRSPVRGNLDGHEIVKITTSQPIRVYIAAAGVAANHGPQGP